MLLPDLLLYMIFLVSLLKQINCYPLLYFRAEKPQLTAGGKTRDSETFLLALQSDNHTHDLDYDAFFLALGTTDREL